MSVNQPSDNLDSLNQETRELWEQIAPAWDDFMGAEGNSFQTVLIGPATERLLGIQPGERVLDIACGNGSFSRRLAQLGAYVVACDFSANFIERAKAHTTQNAGRIEY
jgi:2-polyprenyl-3-methyl-5-hydroxy-6-metoxy-1,4-benzoquinol methylase